jgi:hypothetical protein
MPATIEVSPIAGQAGLHSHWAFCLALAAIRKYPTVMLEEHWCAMYRPTGKG